MNGHDDMSDTDVLDIVRDRLSGMPVTDPPDVRVIMARGRSHRHRRLIPGVTAVAAGAATVAGAALAVPALTPASHPASPQASHPADRQPAVQLAAWTVTRLGDGDISVTIRELKDPAGLQNTLRTDGVPASVTFASGQNPACQPYPGGAPQPLPQPTTPLLKRVFPKPYDTIRLLKHPTALSSVPANSRPAAPSAPSPNGTLIVIDLSALPGNAGVQLGINYEGRAVLLPRVVYASPACTGG